MLKQIDAVLFDLDGTVMDSMWLWLDIDIEYLGKYGIALPTDLQKNIEGMGFTETAHYFKNRFSIPDTIEEIKANWNQMAYEKYACEVLPKSGVESFLKNLKERGIQTAIASSNSHELIQACLNHNHLEEYFDCIVTSCDVAKGKPAPDIYLKAAQLLGVCAERCLVFEDVPMGILAGKAAGMRVCAVQDAYSEDQIEKKRQLADYYITSYDEIENGTYEVLL